MKNILILLAFFSLTGTSSLLGQGNLIEKTEFKVGNESFQLKVFNVDENSFKVDLNASSNPDLIESFTMSPLSIENFKAGILNKLEELKADSNVKNAIGQMSQEQQVEKIDTISSIIFGEVTSSILNDTRPLAGKLTVYHKVPVSSLNSGESSLFESLKDEFEDYRAGVASVFPNAPETKSLYDIKWPEETRNSIVNRLLQVKNLTPDNQAIDDLTDNFLKQIDAFFYSEARLDLVDNLFELQNLFNQEELYEDSTQFNQEIDAVSKRLSPTSIKSFSNRLVKAYKEAFKEEKEINKIKNKHRKELPDIIRFGSNKTYSDTMIVSNFQMEFENGFMEQVMISGKLASSDEPISFTNKYPIGFSSKRDFEKLGYTSLFSKALKNGQKYQLSMDEFFLYNQEHFFQRRDFSPGNDVVKRNINKDSDFELYRDKNNDILEGKVFTDIVGINEDNPNGLVQFEISKQFVLQTRRMGLFGSRGYGLNGGLLHSLNLYATLAKIEENNRDLRFESFNQIINNQLYSITYAPTMDLFSQNYLRVGGELELITFDSPALKSKWVLTAGFEGALTRVFERKYELQEDNIVITDTLDPISVPTIRPILGLDYHIFSDGRVGAIINFQTSYSYLLNTTNTQDNAPLVQVGDPEIYLQRNSGFTDEVNNDRFFFTFGIKEFFIKGANENRGKLFFRAQLHWLVNHGNEYFYQIQGGYAVNLTELINLTKKK